jgi:hypothetical protein
MTGRVVGAISNLSAAGVVVPSLLVVLPVVPSPEPAAGVSPALVVVVLGAALVPNPAGSPSDPALAPPAS